MTIVSTLSGPVEIIVIGTPKRLSRNDRYCLALSGRCSTLWIPSVEQFQPATVSYFGVISFNASLSEGKETSLPSEFVYPVQTLISSKSS